MAPPGSLLLREQALPVHPRQVPGLAVARPLGGGRRLWGLALSPRPPCAKRGDRCAAGGHGAAPGREVPLARPAAAAARGTQETWYAAPRRRQPRRIPSPAAR